MIPSGLNHIIIVAKGGIVMFGFVVPTVQFTCAIMTTNFSCRPVYDVTTRFPVWRLCLDAFLPDDVGRFAGSREQDHP